MLRYHIKYPIEDEFDISPAESKNDVVYKLLGLNDRFVQTKLYHDFKIDILKSFTKNLRLGHVLVEGNYEDKELLRQLADLALLSNGLLKGKALADFISRSAKVVKDAYLK